MKRFGRVNESEIVTQDINNIYKMIAKKYPNMLSKFETSIADFVDQQNSSANSLVINEGQEEEAMESVSNFMKKIGDGVKNASRSANDYLSTAKESAEDEAIRNEVSEYMDDEDADEDEAIEVVAAGNGITVNECRRIFKRGRRVNESYGSFERNQSDWGTIFKYLKDSIKKLGLDLEVDYRKDYDTKEEFADIIGKAADISKLVDFVNKDKKNKDIYRIKLTEDGIEGDDDDLNESIVSVKVGKKVNESASLSDHNIIIEVNAKYKKYNSFHGKLDASDIQSLVSDVAEKYRVKISDVEFDNSSLGIDTFTATATGDYKQIQKMANDNQNDLVISVYDPNESRTNKGGKKVNESTQTKTTLYNSLLDIVLKNKGKVSEKEVVETLNQLASDIDENGFGIGKINEDDEEEALPTFESWRRKRNRR